MPPIIVLLYNKETEHSYLGLSSRCVRYSTLSPCLTLLSRRVQSFGKRVWFTESHIVLIISFLLVVLFTQFIVDKIRKGVLYQVKQLIIFY